MATARVIDSYVIDFLNFLEAQPVTMFCNLCKNYLGEKIFEKHLKSKPHLFKRGEKLKCNVCSLNVIRNTYRLNLKSIEHSLKRGVKNKTRIFGKIMIRLFA